MTTVTDNQFMRIAIEAMKPGILKRLDDINYELTRDEEYIFSVGNALLRIDRIYKQLEQIVEYLESQSLTNNILASKIPHIDWFKYHLENHSIRISTIGDLLLVLINKVYMLGISDKLCNINLVTTNENISNTGSVKIIKEYFQYIKDIKRVRNSMIHNGIFVDNDLDEIGLYEFMSNFDKKSKIWSDLNLSKKHSEYKLNTIEKRIKTIKLSNEKVSVFIQEIYGTLIDIFGQRLTAANIAYKK